ncbi:hypothetical protein NUW54_g641 [Trametes sanguinea]|uniref:Uncharacterized protein n=1 Tax=Trametes sanguinea TaxID=158606 RepID=A0ACC1QCH5_9APHY|nr:hypothetical protein NUW54_g641 [Trametes sanguinea]
MKQLIQRISPGIRRFSLSTTLQAQPRPSPQTPFRVRRWEDIEELLEDYDPAVNGYCPVKIGDVLGEHYNVVQKLGWGVYSTVWLAKDQRYEHRVIVLSKFSPVRCRIVSCFAMIERSAVEVATEAQNQLHEVDYLRKMQVTSPQHPGYAHVVHLKDQYYQESLAGRHLCLTMEPLSKDLRLFSLRWKNRLLPLPAVRHLARQIVLGLLYLHDECNIIHTDIKPANILLAPPGDQSSFFAQATLDAEVETSDAQGPNGAVVTRVRIVPIPYPIPDWGSNPDSVEPWRALQAKIGDVGVACWADKVSEHFTE